MLIKNLTKRIVGTFIDKRPVSLRPGNNDVSPSDWAILKEQFLIKHMLEADELIEPSSAHPAAAPKVQNLAAFNEKEAIREVKNTADVSLLETWYVAEKRKKVAAAIEAQLKTLELKPGTTTDEGDAGDGDDEPPAEE